MSNIITFAARYGGVRTIELADNFRSSKGIVELGRSIAERLDTLQCFCVNPIRVKAELRKQQPRMLIVWGKNDPFFTVEGAKAYQRDLPKAALHLIDTGHFALEDSCDFIAERIRGFLG